MSTEDICPIMPTCYLKHQMSMVGKMALKESALMEIINQEGNLNSWKSLVVCSVDLKHHPQLIAEKTKGGLTPKLTAFPLSENQFMAAM